jgi:DNA invertase Pin-like site-specific DNA recombinase
MIAKQQRYVAYYRVSTAKQGRSGLGLEAQQQTVTHFLAGRGGKLLKQYTEVESGRKADRVQLDRALEACKLHGATLVIAKLDRLSRNAPFLMNLQESGASFVCCDNPHANKAMIGIMAIMAQQEAETISKNTKAALAAAKARGVKLGTAGVRNLRNRKLGSQRGVATRNRQAQEHAERVGTVIRPMVEQRLSLRAIAARLNDATVDTVRGGAWSANQVKQVIDRLELRP